MNKVIKLLMDRMEYYDKLDNMAKGLTAKQEGIRHGIDVAIRTIEKHGDGWIPFEAEVNDGYLTLVGTIPDENQEILITDGKSVFTDTFMADGREFYLDSGWAIIDDIIAWQPLPEPYEVKK